jgi:hypothetical protein
VLIPEPISKATLMKHLFRKAIPLISCSMLAMPVMASDTVDAAIGGAVGGATGAVIGSELGGREGAIAGAAVGAAVGTAVATNDGKGDADIPVHADGHYRKKGGPPPHAYHAPPGHVKNGKAKGRW